MTETKPKSSRQIAIRFDQESYERLQQMSGAAGENVVEIIRQLIARALADERSLELVAALGAVLLGFERVGDRERIEARNVVGVGEADPHNTQSRM